MHGRGGLDGGWWLAGLAAALLCGTALQLLQARTLPVAWAAGLALAGAVAAWALRRWMPLCALALAVAAFGATDLRASARLADGLAPALEGRDLAIEGRIFGLPQDTPGGKRFMFAVESAPPGVPAHLSLLWLQGSDAGTSSPGSMAEPEPGERWAFTVRLKAPHAALNPHGFDFELWMFERGLRAGGYVRAGAATPARRLAAAEGAWVDRLRLHLRRAIQTRVAEPRSAGVLAALVVGDQGAIELGTDNQVVL